MASTSGSQTETKPITNATVASEHRKKKLVRKNSGPNPLKYKIWLAGHLMSLIFGGISSIFQLLWLPNRYYINSISYRLSLLGSVLALGATFSHKFGLRFLPPPLTMVAQQNFQYLVLAFLWCFTFKSVFKLIPFLLISTLQLGAHKKIGAIEKQLDFLASLIAYDELLLIVYLFLRTVFLRGWSGYQLVVFLVFYWLRILYNKETGNLFRSIVDRLDGKIQGKNEKLTHYWDKTKMFFDEKQHSEM
jgi:hypothetical protein